MPGTRALALAAGAAIGCLLLADPLRADPPLGDAAFRPSPARPVGHRGDGNNIYPAATPPTAWNIHDGTNIRWFTPLDWGKAAPVIVGDRVFVGEECDALVCLDRATGRVLWKSRLSALETVKPAALPRWRELVAAVESCRAAELALGGWYGEREKKLRAQGMDDEAARKEVLRLRDATRLARKECARLLVGEAGAVWPICFDSAMACGPWSGFTFPTPVTDGRHVWVKHVSGMNACYDLDGRCIWKVRIPYEINQGSELSSPVLVDGRLILQLAHKQPTPIWLKYDRVYLIALDAATGEELWRADAKDYRPSSSPAVVRLPRHGKPPLTVLVTGSGTVLRAEDGKPLGELPGNVDCYGGITQQDNVLYRSGGGEIGAVRVTAADDGTVRGEVLWRHPVETHPGGLAIHDGILSSLRGLTSCKGLDLFDAGTGVRLDRPHNRGVKNVGALRWAAIWIAPLVTRDDVYYSDRGTSGWEKPFDYAAVTVTQRGREGRILAHNDMPRTLDTPLVPHGEELFARVDEGLLCIGYTGEAGRRYEAVTNARLILDDIRPTPPPPRPARTVPCVAPPATNHPAFGLGYRQFFRVPIRTDGGAELAKRPRLVFDRGHEVMDSASLPWTTSATFTVTERLVVREEQTVRVTDIGTNLSFAVSGQTVQNDDRLTLAPGTHELVGTVAKPADTHRPAPIQIRFEDSRDPEAELLAWREAIERNTAILRRVAAIAPGTPEAAEASRLLNAARAGTAEVVVCEESLTLPH